MVSRRADCVCRRCSLRLVVLPTPTHPVEFMPLLRVVLFRVLQLIEKPVGRNAGEVRDMIEACRANNVQLMDGASWRRVVSPPPRLSSTVSWRACTQA